MRRVTAPTPTQEGSTCSAYSVARITNRVLELTDNKSEYNSRNILNWCKLHYGIKDGAKSNEVLEKIISVDWPDLCTNKIRHILEIKFYDHFTEDIKQLIVNALASKREVICAMFIDTKLFSTYGSTNNKILSDETFPSFPTYENYSNCFWHDVVLFKWENGLLYFKNSHGSKWGINGSFIVSEKTLFCAPANFEFIDLCFRTDTDGNIVDEKGNIRADIHRSIEDYRPCPIVLIKTIPINNSIYEDIPAVKIGSGKQATVLLGTCTIDNVNKSVALRRCPVNNDELMSIESKLYNFDHPNIVKMYGYKKTELASETSHIYIAMERENCSLSYFYSEIITTNNEPFEVNWGLFYFIVLDVASGLSYLHKEGVVHGDICSDNIVLSASGVAKLIDFQAGVLAGTLYHNNAGHDGWVEPREGLSAEYYTDMYSIGKLMIYLLYGTVTPPGVDFTMGDISPTTRIPKAIYKLICNCINPIKLQRPSAKQFYDEFNHAFVNKLVPNVEIKNTNCSIQVSSSVDGSGMCRFTNGTTQIGQFNINSQEFDENSSIKIPMSESKIAEVKLFSYVWWRIRFMKYYKVVYILLATVTLMAVVVLSAYVLSQSEYFAQSNQTCEGGTLVSLQHCKSLVKRKNEYIALANRPPLPIESKYCGYEGVKEYLWDAKYFEIQFGGFKFGIDRPRIAVKEMLLDHACDRALLLTNSYVEKVNKELAEEKLEYGRISIALEEELNKCRLVYGNNKF